MDAWKHLNYQTLFLLCYPRSFPQLHLYIVLEIQTWVDSGGGRRWRRSTLNWVCSFPRRLSFVGPEMTGWRSDSRTKGDQNACSFSGAFVFIIELLCAYKSVFYRSRVSRIVFHSGSIWLRIISEILSITCHHYLVVGSFYLCNRIVHFISKSHSCFLNSVINYFLACGDHWVKKYVWFPK